MRKGFDEENKIRNMPAAGYAPFINRNMCFILFVSIGGITKNTQTKIEGVLILKIINLETDAELLEIDIDELKALLNIDPS